MYSDDSSRFSALFVTSEEEIVKLQNLLPGMLEDDVAVLYDARHHLRYMRLAREPGSRWIQDNEGGAANFLSWLGESSFSGVFRGGVLGAKRIIEDLRSSRDVHRREVLSLLRRGHSRDAT
jgi:hypothetical protein